MTKINLKISSLRKLKSISQKQLADTLGVSYQTVSKWENGICMPDITLLPAISEYFKVSVDELLGLKPLNEVDYIPSKTDTKDYWDSKMEYLKRTRNSFWNLDYIKFLVKDVWKINRKVDIIDFGCGYGFLGQLLLPMLPKGSTYTGIDINDKLINEANALFENCEYKTKFILKNINDFKPDRTYDIAICQAFLRHMNNPVNILENMIKSVKSGGLVICIEVNREIESDGLYVDGIDYSFLCKRNGYEKLWKKELETQGRDYAIGIKIPVIMNKLGLKNVEVRINDKVNFIQPNKSDYKEVLNDFIISKDLKEDYRFNENNKLIESLMNHGMDKNDAENSLNKNKKISNHIYNNIHDLSILHLYGLLISYGLKP